MSKFIIEQIDRHAKESYKRWKEFSRNANGATIFHDPDFLSYHGTKFDEHHIAIYKGESLFGVIPLAIFSNGDKKTQNLHMTLLMEVLFFLLFRTIQIVTIQHSSNLIVTLLARNFPNNQYRNI